MADEPPSLRLLRDIREYIGGFKNFYTPDIKRQSIILGVFKEKIRDLNRSVPHNANGKLLKPYTGGFEVLLGIKRALERLYNPELPDVSGQIMQIISRNLKKLDLLIRKIELGLILKSSNKKNESVSTSFLDTIREIETLDMSIYKLELLVGMRKPPAAEAKGGRRTRRKRRTRRH